MKSLHVHVVFPVPHPCVELIALCWCAWLIMHGYTHAQFCSTC